MKKKSEEKKVQYICNRCGALLPDNHLLIKTKRGTVLRLCCKCTKEGL